MALHRFLLLFGKDIQAASSFSWIRFGLIIKICQFLFDKIETNYLCFLSNREQTKAIPLQMEKVILKPQRPTISKSFLLEL
ncbi:blast:Myotrophin [Drosophila guanche]|uniref:Blast:Myotrophin n=1 Tax=Drosophila guanche TaxID=7266 RepID=A0A3B0JHK0_DROGU|nr:blast:Myotrophin [Drosophila guanche]